MATSYSCLIKIMLNEQQERKIILKKKRKAVYKKMLIIIIPLIIVFLVLSFFAGKNLVNIIGTFTGETGTSYSNSIEEYGYYLRSNPTKYQKEIFSDLKKIMADENATDEEKITLVAKNYIADMYTWTNKAGSYDVGGICYVYSVHRGNISLEARDSFYKYLSLYIKEYGSDALLEVESVDVTLIAEYGSEYVYHNDGTVQDDNLWGVEVYWNYVEKDKFNDSNYMTHAFMLVSKRDDGRIEILECYGE